MKKSLLITAFAVLVFLTSCGGKNNQIDPFAPITGMVDSARSQKNDSSLLNKEPVQMKADDSFNDFIYTFATDKDMQMSRIRFPLTFYNNNVASKIARKQWKHDPLYSNQAYYTLLFDKEEDMDLVQDTSLYSVQFEWIYMNTQMVKRYYFERKKDIWMLEAINLHSIENTENENFVAFLSRFVTDSVFQSKRVVDPLVFVTADPDDDFSILEATIDLNQWFAFRPPLLKDRLTNINYGQTISEDSRYKILALKGIGNGFSNTLYFERKGDEWMLYKFEDLSD